MKPARAALQAVTINGEDSLRKTWADATMDTSNYHYRLKKKLSVVAQSVLIKIKYRD